MTDVAVAWFDEHFGVAAGLLAKPVFRDAVHALASYRWHTMPRAQLALIWAGIEGLFAIESELSFRVSLYAARFLHSADPTAQKATFDAVRKLYKERSKAVHGSADTGGREAAVSQSADLLATLLRRCVERRQLPQPDALAP